VGAIVLGRCRCTQVWVCMQRILVKAMKKTHDRSVEVARTVNCEFGCQMKDGNDELRCLGNVSLCEADCFESK